MISEKLASAYTKLEDKYFDALDFLDNKGLPVYKYSDFFENRGVPSFVVTIAIIVAILLLIIFAIGYVPPVAGEITLSMRSGSTPLLNVDVLIKDAQGEVLFEGKASDGQKVALTRPLKEGETILVTANKDGYQTVSTSFTVTKDNPPQNLSFEADFRGIEAQLRLIDKETKTIIEGARVTASSGTDLIYEFLEDTNGIYKKTGIPQGKSLLVEITADGYNKYNEMLIFNEGQMREISLDPSISAFVGNANVVVEVSDNNSKLITGAQVTVTNKDTGVLLMSGPTIQGLLIGKVQTGIPLRIQVKKEGYISYDSQTVGGGITLRELEKRIQIQLTKGGQKLRVSAIDSQSGFSLEGAVVQLFGSSDNRLIDSGTTQISGYDFDGLNSNEMIYATAYKEGYLSARISFFIGAQEEVKINMQKTTATNSTRLDIYTIDKSAVPVNAAQVMIFEIADGNKVPYGVPVFETSIEGYKNVTVASEKTYMLEGYTDTMIGDASVEVAKTEVSKKVYLNMKKRPNILEISFIDVYGKPVIGKVIVSSLEGESLYDEDISKNGRIFFDARQKSRVDVEVTTLDGNVFSEQVTIQGKDFVEVVVYNKDSTALAPLIDFVGIEDELGSAVLGITPGAFYWAKYTVIFPRAATKAGVHFRIGQDTTTLATSEKFGIFDLGFLGAENFYSQSYTPTPEPGNEAVDRTAVGQQGQKNKWVEGIIAQPKGTYTVKVKVRAEDFTAGKVQMKYRAWAIVGGGYYRTPQDLVLETKAVTDKKAGLYAETKVQDFTLFESLPECSNNICMTVNFVDDSENYISSSGFEAIKDKSYGLEAEVTTKEADYIQIAVSSDSNIDFDLTQTSNFNFAVQRGTAAAKKNSSTEVSLSNNGKQKVRFYFTPRASGPASIRVSASGKTIVEKELLFNVVLEKTLLFEFSKSQLAPGENFNIKVTDSSSNAVTNSTIKILDKSGKVIKTISGNGKEGTGKNGQYKVENNFSPGLYTAEVSAPFYKTQSAAFMVSSKIGLVFPESIDVKMSAGQLSATLSPQIENSSDFTIQDIYVQIGDESEITRTTSDKNLMSLYNSATGLINNQSQSAGQFTINVTPLQSLSKGQKQALPITVSYTGSAGDTADETAMIVISGMVEGKFLTKTMSSMHMVYNRKLDPACLLAEPTSVTLSMIGLPGATDATSIDFTNKCDETLNLTKKQQKVNLSSGIEVASDVQLSIQPGETKQVTVSATNYFERASVREEVQTFSLVYDSNSLKKTISVIVKTTNPTFALSYPPQLTLWLAQSNLTQKAVAAEPMFISNISSFPVDNISFSVNSSYFQQANVRLTVEPSGNVSLLPGQSIVPPKVVFAQANSKISEPARATIEISGKMGQLANRTGQLDNYNYYNQYNNYPSASNSGTAGFVNNSGITGTTYTSGYGTTGYGTSGNATGYSNTYGNGNGLNGSTSYNNGYNGYYSNGYNSNNYSSPTYGYSGSLYNNGYNGYNGNSGYNSYNGGSMYGGYGGLANYAPASSAYYNNTLRILGQIDVSVFYSGYNCLKARLLTEGEGFYFPIEGAQTAKMITVTNTCAEPVRILGASSASEAKMPQMFGVSPMMKSVMLFLPQVSITPGQAVNLSLSVMTAIPNMNVKTYQVIVNAVSEISQTQMVSQPFGISLYAGTEIGAEHFKGTKINATICKDPSTPKAETKKEQITAPKIVSGPSCNQGYCDAKDAAKYLASAIRAQISKAQAKGYGTQASEDVMGCMSTGACTFDELGIPVEPIDLYLQNDKITTEILERELNGKEYEGANTTPFRETPMSTGFTVLSESIDIAFLKPIAMTGYDRKVYLDRELEGCGYYRVRISGAFKATTQGLETMTPVIAVKVMPINGLPKLITKECLPSMNNVLNFNPLDLGLDEGTDYGTWLTTVTTDPSFELIAKEIAQKRYKSDKRVTSTGIGNKVVLKQGALQGTLAQMCMTGNDRKTIEVTIDNSVSRSNDKSTKDKFTTAIVQMVSNVLNGAFGDNCFVKTGDSYPCINLTDLTKEGTRKISLVSPTLLFASKDGGCVTGTVYSNVPGEQLQFVIEPKTNQANGKNFTGVSRITISTDDKIKKPIASAPPLTSLVQTPTNLTSTSQPIQPPSIASPSQSSPPGANLGTSSARTSPQDSTTKSPSTGAFTTLQPQTVGTSAIAIQSGTISTAPPLTIFGTNPLVEEVKVLNILPGNQQGSEKDNWIKLIENKTSTDYKYYRNIKICAMPSTQEAGDKLPLTAYINANGSQFDIALINSLANETNAGERQTITINIGTLHPSDLADILCKKTEIDKLGNDYHYYFTLNWMEDAESPSQYIYSQYMEGLINSGKLNTCPMYTTQSGTGGTEYGKQVKKDAAGSGVLAYFGACSAASVACNAVVTGIGSAVSPLWDCILPGVITYKENIANSSSTATDVFSTIEKYMRMVPGFGWLADWVKVKSDFKPEPKNIITTGLIDGTIASIPRAYLVRSDWARITAGLSSEGWITKGSIDQTAEQTASYVREKVLGLDAKGAIIKDSTGKLVSGSLAEALELDKPTKVALIDKAELENLAKRVEALTDERIAKGMEEYRKVNYAQKTLPKRIVPLTSGYVDPSLRPTFEQGLLEAVSKANLDTVTTDALMEDRGGVPAIQKLFKGLGPNATTKDLQAVTAKFPKLAGIITKISSTADPAIKASIETTLSVLKKGGVGDELIRAPSQLEIEDAVKTVLKQKIMPTAKPAEITKAAKSIMSSMPPTVITPAFDEAALKTAFKNYLVTNTFVASGGTAITKDLALIDVKNGLNTVLSARPEFSGFTAAEKAAIVNEVAGKVTGGSSLVPRGATVDAILNTLGTETGASFITRLPKTGASLSGWSEMISQRVNAGAGKAIVEEDMKAFGTEVAKITSKVGAGDVEKEMARFAKGQRIWAGLKQFGKISACSVVANIAGTAAYDAMIEKKTSGFNAITTKTENPNQMFVRGKTYRLTVTQDTLGKTGYTTKFEEVSTPIQQAQMEKDIAEKKGKMLTFKETTEEKRPPEMRPLEVWLLKTTLTTERELLDKYNYPAAGKDADKLAVAKSHIKILQNREIQKLIYYYTDPVLIDGKDNKKAILNAEEPLAIAILLQGWKDFEKQKDSEFANYTGWLRDKLVIAATERVKYPGEDAFKTPANGRALAVKIFPELKGNIEAQDNFLKLYNSWQQVWTNSTSARATNTGGSTIK